MDFFSPLLHAHLLGEWNDPVYAPPKPTTFDVDYYVETPRGSRSRFTRRSGLTQINGARSETAVYMYLKRLHPGCTITIQNLDFK